MKSKKHIFFKQLDKFIFKYHLIKFLQSLTIGIALLISISLLLIFFNYFTYPDTGIKKVIFGFYVLISLGILTEFILSKIPPLFIKKKRLSYRQAASIIIKMDPDFDDRVISIIEFEESGSQNPLIIASINQKIKQLKFLDFKNILSLSPVKKSLIYLATTLAFLFLIAMFNADILRKGTVKLVNYNKYYPKPAPFHFVLLDKKLETKQDSDFVVHLMIKGRQIPQNVFINISGQAYIMQPDKKSPGLFTYTIKNPQEPIDFYFSAAGFKSPFYRLKIKYIPLITSSKFLIIPPAYTKLKQQYFYNSSNLVVPQGSTINCWLKTENTASIILIKDSVALDTLNAKHKTFFSIIAGHDMLLGIKLIGTSSITNTIQVKIKTIPDQPPSLKLYETTDSTNLNIKYFHLEISDDYGISTLKFFIQSEKQTTSFKIPVSHDREQIQNLVFSFDSITDKANNVTYYFVVCDNRRPKPNCTQSEKYTFTKPDPASLSDIIDSLDQQLQQKAETANLLAQQLKDLANQYQQKLLTENLSDWEKKEATRQLAQKTNELQNLLQEIDQLNRQRNSLINSFSNISKELEQKQQMLDQLLKQILNKDLQKLLEQLSQILQEKQPGTKPQNLQQLAQQYQMLSQRLDKTLEFYKKIALQQQLEQQSKTLKQLYTRQDSLRKALTHTKHTQKLATTQQQIQKQLQQASEQYQKALEQNRTLNHPMPMQDLSASFNQIQQMMQQNQQLLSQGKKAKSKHLQKQIIDSLNSLSQKLQQNLRQAQAKAQMLDLQKIYKLITYFELFSNNTEKTIIQTQKLHPGSQSLPAITNSIILLKKQYSPISDSLLSLSAENIQLANIIDQKVYKIHSDFSQLDKYLDRRMHTMVITTEKDILSNANIILLILTQVANSIEKQMQNAMPNMQQQGQQQALMPLQQLQQQLQKQLEKLLEQAQKGQLNPKDLAQTLILKEKINFETEKLLDQFSNSIDIAKKLKEIKKINNQIERNLVDKQLDESIIKQAQLMKVKLWEAQDAIKRQNEYEKRRIAEHQKQIFYNSNVKKLNLYQKQYTDYQDIIKLKTIKLNQFYNDIYKSYRLNQ